MPQRTRYNSDVVDLAADQSPHGSPPVSVDLCQYVGKEGLADSPAPDGYGTCLEWVPSSGTSLLEPNLQQQQLVGCRPEYHLLPHSVSADSPHCLPDPEADHPLALEALFQQSRTSSSESSSNVSADAACTRVGGQQGCCNTSEDGLLELSARTAAPRRYRRMVCYSRTGLVPVVADSPPERSSSIPVHLDQISKEPSKGGRHSSRQRRILACLALSELLLGCCWVVLIPFFPSEAESRGVGESVIGLVFSSYALTLLIMTPITGPLIQMLGMTQVLCFGLFLTGLATVAFGALEYVHSEWLFVALCFTVRMVSAVGASMYVTASFTFIANQFQSNVNYAVGVVETCSAVGMSIGPAIGGGLYELGSYGLPFYVIGGTMLVTAGVNVWLMPVIARDCGRRRDVANMARRLFRSTDVWLCLFVLMTISIDYSSSEPGIQPYASKMFGITQSQMGLYFLVSSGAYALVSPLWGRLSDLATNSYIQVSVCMAGSAVSLLLLAPVDLLYPLVPSWWMLGLGMTLFEMFSAGAFIPLFSNMLTAAVEEGLGDNVATQSFVSSVWWAVFSMGSVVGPAFSGVVIQQSGFPTIMACVAALTTVCAMLSLLRACPRGCRCSRALRYKLLGGGADETQPLLDGRDRRASV